MKKAVILHATDSNSQDNWYPWLKNQLTTRGWQVWTPNLPGAQVPSPANYNPFIQDNIPWKIDEYTSFIGHSSGAVSILNLFNDLPIETKVGTCFFVGAFKDDLGWDELNKLFSKPFDFDKLKSQIKKSVFVHSDNDPYCPLKHAKYFSNKLGGELIILPNQKHFSISTAGEDYREFPKLLEIIEEES